MSDNTPELIVGLVVSQAVVVVRVLCVEVVSISFAVSAAGLKSLIPSPVISGVNTPEGTVIVVVEVAIYPRGPPAIVIVMIVCVLSIASVFNVVGTVMVPSVAKSPNPCNAPTAAKSPTVAVLAAIVADAVVRPVIDTFSL